MTLDQYLSTGNTLKWLLGAAWLLPLVGFMIEILGGYWGKRIDPASNGRKTRAAGYIAVGCIGTGCILSTIALFTWGNATHWGHPGGDEHSVALASHADAEDAGHADPAAADHEHAADDAAETAHAHDTEADEAAAIATTPVDDLHTIEHGEGHEHHANDPYAAAFYGSFYRLMTFGSLYIDIDYYIDGLTLVMFVMVTFIATCIHVFALGYMSEELTEDYEDHQVHLSGGRHFHRPGRFYQFFAYFSLFSFSMLGLVIAGNIFMVFIFWELVGICSYLLIGFYTERKSASTAANKAFIMNRVGDFGFLIGLMVLWTYFGTFQFANPSPSGGSPGLFQMLRAPDGSIAVDDAADPRDVTLHNVDGTSLVRGENSKTIPYMLLIVAGLGVFAGCIGKSAQFPLQTWLPDAMEGPTPVSALVHSATMVAAGVYLAGRFYPMFVPEVLLTIAYIGCITLFIGATIALVATDIKRVLAYSTISQLGYMMLALGVGGWIAGLFHLITHAFFKSLLFLCSGSVIHGCHHEQEMTKMGGLRTKMPFTAATMLIGCIAISGLAIPGTFIAFSGYHSKDAILATSLAFVSTNSGHILLFVVPLITAGLTAFYMFRLWFMTFAGQPRDQHVHEHAHESPWVMVAPLLVLSVPAMFVAFGGEAGPLASLMLTSEPAHLAAGVDSTAVMDVTHPGHETIHGYHNTAGMLALLAAASGVVLSYFFYGRKVVDPNAIREQVPGVYGFLVEKWQFDRLYEVLWVQPVHMVARGCQWFDKHVLDCFADGMAKVSVRIAGLDRQFDEAFVDGFVNWLARVTHGTGAVLKNVQTGNLRQYVMFIALGLVGLFGLFLALIPK